MLGDIAGARRHTEAQLVLAERLRNRNCLALALGGNGAVFRLAGDWRAARDYTDRGLEVVPTHQTLLSYKVLLEYEVGNFDQGESYLKKLLEVMHQTPPGPTVAHAYPAMVIPLVAGISGVVDRFDIAQAAAEAVLASPSAAPVVSIIARSSLALMAVQRGDMAAAQEQYAALEQGRGTVLMMISTSVDRLLGLIAQTVGKLDDAKGHFEDALAFCRKAGYRPELAWSCYDYADVLHKRNGQGDRAKAISLLTESLDIAAELSMRPLKERVTERLARVQAQPNAAPTHPAGLTEREVEVLRLLASGKSNAVIAAELVLSVRTVERHISNIYGKTNSHSRAEATAFAFTHGLMSST